MLVPISVLNNHFIPHDIWSLSSIAPHFVRAFLMSEHWNYWFLRGKLGSLVTGAGEAGTRPRCPVKLLAIFLLICIMLPLFIGGKE